MTKAFAAAAAVLAAFPLFLILLVTASAGTLAQAAPAATGLAGHADRAGHVRNPCGTTWPGTWPPRRPAPACPGQCWRASARPNGHGRWLLPGVRSGSDSAGAQGPMQLEPSPSTSSRSTPTPASRSAPTTRPTPLHRRRDAVRERRPRRHPGRPPGCGFRLQPRQLVRQRGHGVGRPVRHPGRQPCRGHRDRLRDGPARQALPVGRSRAGRL